jgi:hypothetical protein
VVALGHLGDYQDQGAFGMVYAKWDDGGAMQPERAAFQNVGLDLITQSRSC